MEAKRKEIIPYGILVIALSAVLWFLKPEQSNALYYILIGLLAWSLYSLGAAVFHYSSRKKTTAALAGTVFRIAKTASDNMDGILAQHDHSAGEVRQFAACCREDNARLKETFLHISLEDTKYAYGEDTLRRMYRIVNIIDQLDLEVNALCEGYREDNQSDTEAFRSRVLYAGRQLKGMLEPGVTRVDINKKKRENPFV